MNILIVDDKPENLYMMDKILKSGGHSVVAAKNGREGLDKLKDNQVQCIVSDILMPEMDGYQFSLKVRSDQRLRNLPFIFLTATYTEKKDEELAMKTGADRFLASPVEPAVLLKTIDEVAAQAKTKKPKAPAAAENQEELCRLYNERLVNKLEQKNQELAQQVDERRRAQEELTSRIRELEIYNKVAVGRELKMIELEKEINSLLTELGRQPRFRST